MAGLTVVTFNIWYEDHMEALRRPALIAILEQCDADVIVLQEVLPEFWGRLIEAPWVKAGGYQAFGEDVQGRVAGIGVLSRQPCRRCSVEPLPGFLGRSLVVAELDGLTVAGVHLESMRSSGPYRAEQLQVIFERLERYEDAVLMGDFNFHDTSAENANLDPRFVDLWPLLRPGEPGFTEDTDINLMRLKVKGKHKQVRYDRILLKTAQPAWWRPRSIELLGAAPVSPDHPEVFPSDHFGLVARLERVG